MDLHQLTLKCLLQTTKSELRIENSFGNHQHMDGNDAMGRDGDHLRKMCVEEMEGQRKGASRFNINDNRQRKGGLDGDQERIPEGTEADQKSRYRIDCCEARRRDSR